jgi:DNA replication protein DnaC
MRPTDCNLVLDDWGPEQLDADQRRDLLEIVEDRYDRRSTIVASQVPIDAWYEFIGNPTIADAVRDRLIHNAQVGCGRWSSGRLRKLARLAGS